MLAYNDVFRLVAVLAALAFLYLVGRWLYLWWYGINPLAEELAAMARLRSTQS